MNIDNRKAKNGAATMRKPGEFVFARIDLPKHSVAVLRRQTKNGTPLRICRGEVLCLK